MKKYLLLTISLLTLSIASITLNPTKAYSASPADNVIINGTMEVKTPNCTLDGNSFYASEAIKNTQFATYMNAAFDAGKGWAVSQLVVGNDTYLDFIVSTDPENSTVEYSSSTYPGGWFYMPNSVQFQLSCSLNNNGDPTPTPYWGMQPADRTIAFNDTSSSLRPVFINTTVNYPPDYEGIIVDDTYIPPSQKTDIRPNIVADVNDKNVTIRSKKHTMLDGTEYKIYWLITNANIDGEGPETPFTLDGYSLPEGTLQFTVPEYGDYQINALFVKMDGSPLQESETLTYKQTVIKVNINGSIFSVDSDKLECGQGENDEDYCDAPINEWTPEECDWLNVFTWGGCISNLFHYIGEALGINKTTSNPTGSPFIAFTTDTKGLTAIITAPLNIFNNLSTGYYTCNPLTIPLPHLNRTLQLPCLGIFYTNHLGGYFNIYQTIIGGIVSYYVIVRMLELIKGFKDPQNDKIEVTKL